MNSKQQQKIKEITDLISTITADSQNKYIVREVLDEDLNWNASLFIAKLIYLAPPLGYECSFNDFLEFKENYEKAKGHQVNTDKLFKSYWLRDVLGFIEIPGAVSSACRTFDKISKFKNELEFLYNFYNSDIKDRRNIEKQLLDDSIKVFESKKNKTLNRDGVYFKEWLSEKEGKIELADLNIYFKPFLDYWEDFKFLTALKNYKWKESRGLEIDNKALRLLHKSFSSFYSKTPSIQKLIDGKLLIQENKHYYLNFNNTTLEYWNQLSDKICGFYWELLIEDSQLEIDKERITKYLQQLSYWNGFPDLLRFSTYLSKKRFLDAAYEMIINEPDLIGVDSEWQKVSIDKRFSSGDIILLFHSKDRYDEYSLNNNDHFELLESLNDWEKKAHTTYLHDQKSREKLAYLIKMVVKYDSEIEREETNDENNPKIHFYKKIIHLLQICLDKPTLLWDVTRYIIMLRKEVIPYLLVDSDFTSLAFQLIDDIEISQDEKIEYSKKLWEKCIELALYTIRSINQEEKQAAKIIFQIFKQLNSTKYNIPYNRQPDNIEITTRKQKENKELTVLTLIENSPLYNHDVHGESEQYLLPNVFNDLVNLFINFKSKPIYNNGTVQFPLKQWDGLAWLMKCSTYWKYQPQFKFSQPDIGLLTNAFFNLYMEIIEVTEIKKYNYLETKEGFVLPSWSEKIERLSFIDWIYPIYFMYKEQKLNSFLEPRFYFDSTNDHYHEKNRFTADKLRTHIGVLIQVLRKLILPSVPYGFDKKELLEIKSRIEQQIIDYLKKHIQDVPKSGRIDLFDYNKEWGFNTSEKEALLPQIARALNWFENKDEIIQVVVQTDDVVKILTIAQWITSEGIKKKLIESIKMSSLESFLKKTYSIPEVQQLLFQIRQYPELTKQINEVIDFWEKKISKRSKEYEFQLFQTRMLLAYFEKNENELNKVEVPKNDVNRRAEGFSNEDYKDFYRALIRVDSDSKSAYALFDKLLMQYSKYPVLALNRMAAKINMAKEKNDDLELYREALEEWNHYENKHHDIVSESLGLTFFINKLLVLLKLAEHDQLDEVYRNLDMPYQMLPEILEFKIESLIERKKIEESISLLEQSENYHKFSGYEEIQFINDLKNKVNGIDNIEELKISYRRIFSSDSLKLIRIFPENLNGRTEITEFITKEVALAASKMLVKINALPEINSLIKTSKENRFNDLIQLALEGRISSWGWSVKDQTRQGFSPSALDLGEIDLDIQDFNKKSFITCEAFILRDKPRVQSHLEKLITYYTNNRKAFIVITYFIGKHSDFEKEWNYYYTDVLASIKYPNGYELDANGVIDVTKDFDYEHTGIKIGKGMLKSGSTLFNVFVNINYKAN